MKFTVDKKKLSHLLYLTSTIVERRNTMPILANVKIVAEKMSISVWATDLEISLIGHTEAEVEQPGSITVGAKVIYDIVRELPAESVKAQLGKGQRLEITSGQSQFKIVGTSAEEFPSLSGVNVDRPLSVDGAKLFEMLDRTAFAVSTDETRYNINGVFVDGIESPIGGDAQGIRFVATDGHRLAMVDRPAEGFKIARGVIIPRKGIQELRKLLEGFEGAASVTVKDGFFTVKTPDVTIGIRLVDGQFPDYHQIIPSDKQTEITIRKDEFLSTVKRVALVTSDKSRTLKLAITGKELVVSSSSPEYGEASDSVAVEKDGEDVTIGFSAKYLIDVLSAMVSSESITVQLNGSLGPGVFFGDGDENYRCIVMPMRFE